MDFKTRNTEYIPRIPNLLLKPFPFNQHILICKLGDNNTCVFNIFFLGNILNQLALFQDFVNRMEF